VEERRRLRLALGASHIPLRPKAACRLHSKSEGTTDRDTVSLTREWTLSHHMLLQGHSETGAD